MTEDENHALQPTEGQGETQFNLMDSINNYSKEKRLQLKQISGAKFPVIGRDLITRLESTIPQIDSNYQMSLAMQTMTDLHPQNAIEGMLCSQIAALHFQGLEYLKRAEEATMRNHQDADLNNAIKLLRLQNEIVEKLSRLKRNNAPKITFQNIKIDQLFFNNIDFTGDGEGGANQINGELHEFSGHITNLSGQVETNRDTMQELCDKGQEGV